MASPELHARLRCRSDAQRPGVSAAAAKHDAMTRSRRRSHPPWSLARRPLPHFLMRRTWSLPLLLVLLVVAVYAARPGDSNIAARFLFLSYRLDDPHTGAAPLYGKGPWDLAFVAFCTVLLSFTREFCMHELLRPLARRCGVKSPAKQARFMEQMYTAAYIAFAGPLGMWCMRRTPVWYFDTRGMFEAYPHKALDQHLKFYYLFQASFWVQQALVMILGLEKRRKDFKELVVHHIATILLIGLSYRFHFTHIGIAVYITHDISDMVLAISKSLNYIGSPLQVPCFALNIASWVYFRHYINIRILYSVLTEFRTVGPFVLDWQAGQYKCWISQVATFVLLAVLQLLNLFWLYCLLRAAYRILFRGIAKDDRSEDEVEPDDTAAQKGNDKEDVVVLSSSDTLKSPKRASGVTSRQTSAQSTR